MATSSILSRLSKAQWATLATVVGIVVFGVLYWYSINDFKSIATNLEDETGVSWAMVAIGNPLDYLFSVLNVAPAVTLMAAGILLVASFNSHSGCARCCLGCGVPTLLVAGLVLLGVTGYAVSEVHDLYEIGEPTCINSGSVDLASLCEKLETAFRINWAGVVGLVCVSLVAIVVSCLGCCNPVAHHRHHHQYERVNSSGEL